MKAPYLKIENNFYLRQTSHSIFATMENLIFLLATSFALRISSNRKSKSHNIGNTGCSALLFPKGQKFNRTTTDTGDRLYFGEFKEAEVTYGIICVELQHRYELTEASGMLCNYMEKLKGPFYALHHTGLQEATDWNSTASVSYIDYWQDGDHQDWKVKGY